MAVTAASILTDLLAEQHVLDTIMAAASEQAWDQATPSPGWTVRDQIAHLAYFDEMAALAIASPEDFADKRDELMASGSSSEEVSLGPARSMTPSDVMEQWRDSRRGLEGAANGLADDTRIEWYGPSMGAKSFLTARLMECWAHGQDIVDTLGVRREPTDRIAHIAQLGYLTRGWTYRNRGLAVPPGEVRVELASPSGQQWVYGADAGAADSTVRGTAVEFCLVTTQRRNIDDTSLVIEGDLGRDWLDKAQLFAGPPSDPPPKRA